MVVDIGAKVSFARSQMLFNVDVEANLSDYFAHLYRFLQQPKPELELEDGYSGVEPTRRKPSLLQHLGGSFTFASVMQDFITGSRINIRYSSLTWSKFFLFAGQDYQPFYPNLNPSFSKLGALEYTLRHQLSTDCVSFSLRRRFPGIFSVVGAVSFISAQTLRGTIYQPYWTVGFVSDDQRTGLEMLAGLNNEGNCCVGFKKQIGESGVSLRLGTVFNFCPDCPFDWKNCIEIGIEM